MKPNKQLIEKRFEKNIVSYEHEAFIQKEIAFKLSRSIEPFLQNPRHILEIGCGTGFLTRHCMQNYPDAFFTLNDLCGNLQPFLSKQLAQPFQFIKGDAEQCTFPSDQDLIVSCSAFQWFQRIDRFFEQCRSILKPRGILAFSTFGEKNFVEIKETTGHSLHYPTINQLTEWLQEGFDIVKATEEIRQTAFANPMEVLRHIRKTGVNSLHSSTWNHKRLETFIENYQQNHSLSTGEVSLTYHPIYIIARKKN